MSDNVCPWWCGRPLAFEDWEFLSRWGTFGEPPSASAPPEAREVWRSLRGPFVDGPTIGRCWKHVEAIVYPPGTAARLHP